MDRIHTMFVLRRLHGIVRILSVVFNFDRRVRDLNEKLPMSDALKKRRRESDEITQRSLIFSSAFRQRYPRLIESMSKGNF